MYQFANLSIETLLHMSGHEVAEAEALRRLQRSAQVSEGRGTLTPCYVVVFNSDRVTVVADRTSGQELVARPIEAQAAG